MLNYNQYTDVYTLVQGRHTAAEFIQEAYEQGHCGIEIDEFDAEDDLVADQARQQHQEGLNRMLDEEGF